MRMQSDSTALVTVRARAQYRHKVRRRARSCVPRQQQGDQRRLSSADKSDQVISRRHFSSLQGFAIYTRMGFVSIFDERNMGWGLMAYRLVSVEPLGRPHPGIGPHLRY